MLSANAPSMPSCRKRVSMPRALGLLFARLSGLFAGLFRPGRPHIPLLPDELRADLGLPEADPGDRLGAFWRQKLSSDGRDLPL